MPKDKAYWKAYNQKRQAYLSQKKKESRQRLKALSTTALLTHPGEKTNSQRGEKTNKKTTKLRQYLIPLFLAFLALANLLIGIIALRSWTILPRLFRTLAIGCIFNNLFGLLAGLYLILAAKKKPSKGGKK